MIVTNSLPRLQLNPVRFDLGSILSGFGQANNNNQKQQQQQNNDPVGNLLGGLLNQNIAVTLNEQGQIQINAVDNNNNNNQGPILQNYFAALSVMDRF